METISEARSEKREARNKDRIRLHTEVRRKREYERISEDQTCKMQTIVRNSLSRRS
jgi:hypothetical protein